MRWLAIATVLLLAGRGQAQDVKKEVWACVTEHVVGIEERDDKRVVTGNFKVDPERFLLTLEGDAAPRLASVSPAFTSAFQEEWMGTAFAFSTFRQKSGLGWLIFRNKEGLAEKYPGETERIFRLGYVSSGAQFIMRGRCVPF